jgi:very-short-patch-repair endonuclease
MTSFEDEGGTMQEEISTSAGQKFNCEICGKKFKAITNTHLKRHGITESEYKESFPHSQLGDFSRFNTWRSSEENKHHLKENAKMVYSNTMLLEKKREARRAACSRSEYLEKLSKISKKNAKTEKMQAVYACAKDRVSKRMRMSNFERWKERFGEEEARNLLESWSKKVKIPSISKNTLPERYFMSMLNELKIHAIQQYPALGFVCDFYVPDYNVIVEIDGDFWHANPNRFSAFDLVGPKRMKAQEVWDRDLKKRNALEKEGYRVIRYWASELKNTTSQRIFEDIVQSSKKLEVPL